MIGRPLNKLLARFRYRVIRTGAPASSQPRRRRVLWHSGPPIDHETRFPRQLRDRDCYQGGTFAPWAGHPDFQRYYDAIKDHTLVTPQSCHTLLSLARQALHLPGDVMECGVYRGGTAKLLAGVIGEFDRRGRRLHLFDTFQGMPKTALDHDYHREGDFGDTSLEAVKALMPAQAPVVFHPGLVPETFVGLEDLSLCLTHCDLDIYQSILDCTAFAYPHTVPGGFLIYDDYGHLTCPGARDAIDEFYADKPEVPLVLSSGQAIVTKLPG
jgi:O-methyltransferase